MTAITWRRGRTVLAVGAVLSLGVMGVVGAATAANAASIDTTRRGSIIIHKFENLGDGEGTPDGTGKLPTTKPIEGVVFEYCAINGIDLLDGTNTGWDAINAITSVQKLAAAAPGATTLASRTLGTCTPLPATDATGAASKNDLPLGAYLVREVSAPSNVVEKAAPFIITLPTPKNHKVLDGDWVYDVHVYPKNTVAQGPVKNLVDQPTNGGLLGAPVDYTVTQLVPALAAGQTYDKLVMSDTLDAKLTPVTATPVTVTLDGMALVSGTDFTPVWAGQKLTVTFTAAGLAKVKAGQNVVFGFRAAVNAPGEIDNQAAVNLNDFSLTPGSANGPDGSPSTTVTTRWGDVNIKKVNAKNVSDGLFGAKFEIYMGITDQACTADITGLTQVKDPADGNPYVVTSDSTGKLAIPGLWVGDTEKTVASDGTVSDTTVAGHDFTARCYVLKEIQAPNGFVLPTGVAALTAVLVDSDLTTPAVLLTIDNTQQGAPELPFTGSNAQLALTIGGIALLIIAFGGVMIIRRRNANRENP
jgi:fimbrial isopeptide formation D2 family protein/LPXTG-motif cell wall-anchored protein